MSPFNDQIAGVIHHRRLHFDIVREICWVENAFARREIDAALTHRILFQPKTVTGQLRIIGPSDMHKIPFGRRRCDGA